MQHQTPKSRVQPSRHDLSINSRQFSVGFDLGMTSFASATFNYFLNKINLFLTT
jgi:hypothetical protein